MRVDERWIVSKLEEQVSRLLVLSDGESQGFEEWDNARGWSVVEREAV